MGWSGGGGGGRGVIFKHYGSTEGRIWNIKGEVGYEKSKACNEGKDTGLP